jgi:two-component system, sensor histidine kinase and response regulator
MNQRLHPENVGRRLILGVDDDPLIVDFLGTIVRSRNFIFFGAESAAAALPTVRHDRPDLIFIDLNMPEMSGMEFCRKIREEIPDYHAPIVFLTATHDEHTVRDAIKAGGNDYVVKPVIPQNILDRLERWLPNEG